MKSKQIAIGQHHLAYYEQNSEADHTIFFVHGNCTSSTAWKEQMSSPLLKDYRLVAFDLPAHGQSSTFPSYTMPALGEVIHTAASQLNKKGAQYIIAGVSIGTNVVAESLAYGQEAAGIALAGPCIVGGSIGLQEVALPDIDLHVGFVEAAPVDEVKTYAILAGLAENSSQLDDFVTAYYQADKAFRPALWDSIISGRHSDEIALLQKAGKPALVIFGADEKICDINYLDNVRLPLWRDKIFKIPAAGHLVQSNQPGIFNQYLKEFADEVIK